MELTTEQKQALAEHGYCRVPGVVPPVMIDAALKAINHSIGEGIPVEQIEKLRATSYCGELQAQPVIVDLLTRTPAWSLAESVLGAGCIKSVGAGQIALRFPRPGHPPAPLHGHLDGMYSPNNGVPKGEIRNFTMLAVVLLSDLPGPWRGNFTVWPGSHLAYEQYFREHGPEALLHGMPPVDLNPPDQLTGRSGDLILTHYQVGHTAGPNFSPHVRYAVIFRLTHVDHDAQRFEVMTDLWREWPGIRALTAAQPA